MKDAVMFAKYNQAGNKTIYDILSKMSNDEREKDRGSYYGSLSGLLRHINGGTQYFLGLFKPVLAGNAGALAAIESIGNIPWPSEGPLDAEQWKELGRVTAALDAAYAAMTETLTEPDLKLPVAVEWYGGNPAAVPLSFMLGCLLVHNTHHRGQISQILDSLKIDNDYSGISAAFV
ncbi:MAG: DinB family protein [Treponema sp.]|jgi:uncharacterized damage-inducible protein DinB|nr:DinB family protein [Treponema sp.]